MEKTGDSGGASLRPRRQGPTYGAVRLLVSLYQETGAVPYDHPLQMGGHGDSCGERGTGRWQREQQADASPAQETEKGCIWGPGKWGKPKSRQHLVICQELLGDLRRRG